MPGKDMSIREFIEHKRIMEVQIQTFLSEKMVEFRKTTGFSPHAIAVTLTSTARVGQKESSYIVTEVDLSTNIGE